VIKSIYTLNDDSFHFVFIGDGAEKTNIVKIASELKVKNVTFIDPVKKSEIPNYLAALDVALIPLKKSTTFESVIPSKVFETVAMNIPILLGVDGETKNLIESYQVGIYFEPENEKDFIEKINLLKKRITENKAVFIQGCNRMAIDFDRKNLARKMLDVLN
jgi:glycosyltransferase involved in cell wall biosynthesis